MGPVARSWLACLAVVCTACSLVVDFPDKAPRDAGDDELDARPLPNESGADVETRDAAVDGSRPDTSGPECVMDMDCDNADLCCFRDGRVQCIPSDVMGCTACGIACSDPRAPNCGARVCECVAGTGKACEAGQTCNGSGATAKCVECLNDNDCTAVIGKPLCDTASNKCVQCKRGDMLESSADDVGCGDVRTPICGPSNTCIGCDDTVPASKCPGTSVCSPGLGCGGCKADVPVVGQNGCTMESLPICRATESGLTQCSACQTNAECKLAEGQGYCAMGRCSNKCDGDGALGANGCANPAAPFCKPATGVPGGFDCAACTAADCANGTFCATTGAKAGSCVQCRADADCPQNGLAPVCDTTTFTCRARTMADCAVTPATPIFNMATGTCVECIDSTQCAGNPKGLVCNPATNTCVGCASSMTCPATAPTCDPATNACVAQCASSNFCRAAHPATPYCNAAMTACVECLDSTNCTADVKKPLCSATNACAACTNTVGCQTKIAGTICVTGGTVYDGACAQCVPGATPNPCPGAATCSPATLLCQ
jgi:hypothetical protein